VKLFPHTELRRAYECAKAGRQALCIYKPSDARRREAAKRRLWYFRDACEWGDLFDQDLRRLSGLVRECGGDVGVNALIINPNNDGQFARLIGEPLRAAAEKCERVTETADTS
jgi:hypothetical protein